MTDLEISKALALAIGWKPTQMRAYALSQTLYCPCAEAEGHDGHGVKFDYRDWNVIGPIAAKYNAFPKKYVGIAKDVFWWCCADGLGEANADTPQKAIALAVIGAMK